MKVATIDITSRRAAPSLTSADAPRRAVAHLDAGASGAARARVAALGLFVGTLSACGDGASRRADVELGADGATDAVSETAAPTDAPVSETVAPTDAAGDADGVDTQAHDALAPEVVCDPVTSEGCEPPLKCTIVLGPLGCGPAGAGGDHTSCVGDGDAACAAGFGCVSTSGGENGTSICRAYCHVDGDCPGDGTSQLCLRLSAEHVPMFCSTVSRCDPFGDGCESGKGCYPALYNDGTNICLEAGQAQVGDACSALSQCKKGGVCVDGTCRELCAVGSACRDGACAALDGATVGVCP